MPGLGSAEISRASTQRTGIGCQKTVDIRQKVTWADLARGVHGKINRIQDSLTERIEQAKRPLKR